MKKHNILLTGATGYVGGKLLKRLESQGHQVNCLVRTPSKMGHTGRLTNVFEGDAMVRSTLWKPLAGVDTAYYLIHALGESHDFESKEIQAAENFASMARAAGVQRIIYIGALGNERDGLSPHLQSRQNVGHTLRESCIPILELRASIILGDGSLSFNLIRDLTEHLPVMVMPRWVASKSQPIGINDVLDYLVEALDVEIAHNEIVEIGGADQMSYGDLMREYAKQRGIRRLMLPVPVLSPWLSSHWISLFSDIDATIGRKLIEGIRSPTVVESIRAKELFPDIEPIGAADAIRRALKASSAHRVGEPVNLEAEHVHAA
ncbi:NAD(P)H-binding protein [Pontiella sp.]|uniref:NAD(P)H-binding protein n=1 Tax=Pontiella sp. TaxID=2837462 RepID=UPI0035618822